MHYLFFLVFPLFAEPIRYFEDFAFESIVHVLEVDLSKCSMELIKCDGVETTSAVAKRLCADAAINGGFFHGGERLGFPSGIFKLHSIQYTPTDRKRGAIGWRSDYSNILIDRLDSAPDGSLEPIFHPENKSQWEIMETILGTTPVLVMDGILLQNFQEEKVISSFLTNCYPRSAIGWIDPTHLVFIVVVKDLEGKSKGMTIPDLANYLYSLGAQFAINLDGGRSSTLYYRGKTICCMGEIDEVDEDANLELVYGERKVGNVIVLKAAK